MRVTDILNTKGEQVITIDAGAPLATAVGIMSASHVGALVVDDGDGRVRGLLSERDIVAAVARWGAAAVTRPVADAMVRDPAIVSVSAGVTEVMAVMTDRRARHLPVIDGDRLAGIVSVGDVLKSRLAEKVEENRVLQDIARWPRVA